MTGVSRIRSTARRTAALAGPISINVELMNTRNRWSGVRIKPGGRTISLLEDDAVIVGRRRNGAALRALIVEQGASRGAVGAARGLAAAGWQVGVGAPGGRGLAAASRACSARHDVPAAHVDVDAFLAATRRAVAAGRYQVVFGAGEAEVMALSAHRAEVPAAVPYAGHDVVCRALDKAELERAAAKVGFALPRTLEPAAVSDPAAPVVIKARRHASPGRRGAPPRVDTNILFGASAAHARIRQIEAEGADPIVQEFLGGQLVAYAAVTDRSAAVVAQSMQVATRIWPTYAGASCRAETVAVDRAIAGKAAALFEALGWFGLAELQFIVPADGVPRLIDLNGRFYGSIALAVAAGANLPATWAALALGGHPAPSCGRPGVRYQWLEGDLRRALRERDPRLAVDLSTTLLSGLGAAHSVIRVRDPGPALLRLRQLLPGRS